MQTFLPFPDFGTSAAVLDRRRLGKQRVENLQIMTALMTGRGFVNHPATLMWRKYEWALLEYHRRIVGEWVDNRGYRDTTLEKVETLYYKNRRWTEEKIMPYWLGDPDFHEAHQSNLIQKDPWYYLRYFPDVPTELPYIWPEPESPYRLLQLPYGLRDRE